MSYADIEISEIMYDAEGSDTDTEWVEIYNNGNEAVDISVWHFFENETHHGLVPDGFSILAPQSYALIVQNVATIRSLYGNSVKLIKSSFSLNNTGETLALSDSAKNIQGSVSYSVNSGANGNGMSLQRNNSEWIQAEPTPGENNQTQGGDTTLPDDEEGEEGESSGGSSSSKKRQVPLPESQEEDIDYYEGFIILGEQQFSGSPVEIEVYVDHTKNRKTTTLKRGKFYLSFGDGNSFESSERFTTQHRYNYPGTYEITLEFYRNEEQFPDEKPDVFIQRSIDIKASTLALDIDNNQGIIISNNTGATIDIGGWVLGASGKHYFFPPYTYIKKGKSITLGPQTHHLPNIYKNTPLTLRNKSSLLIFSYPSDVVKPTVSTGSSHLKMKASGIENNEVDQREQTHLEDFLQEYPDKHQVSFESNQEIFDKINSAESDTDTTSKLPLLLVLGVGTLAIMLGLIKVFSQQRMRENDIEDSEPVKGNIELIE